MSSREALHWLVDEIPENEIGRAQRVLGALLEPRNPLDTLAAAPEDDEPETSEERTAVKEALREIREGKPGLSTSELERELGLR